MGKYATYKDKPQYFKKQVCLCKEFGIRQQ